MDKKSKLEKIWKDKKMTMKDVDKIDVKKLFQQKGVKYGKLFWEQGFYHSIWQGNVY